MRHYPKGSVLFYYRNRFDKTLTRLTFFLTFFPVQCAHGEEGGRADEPRVQAHADALRGRLRPWCCPRRRRRRSPAGGIEAQGEVKEDQRGQWIGDASSGPSAHRGAHSSGQQLSAATAAAVWTPSSKHPSP